MRYAGGRPRVVIIGGGFAGLYAARVLRKHPVDVTVIDRRNHHLFQPLLYQVATAALSPSEIAYPIRAIFSDDDAVRVLLGEVTGFDLDGKRVLLGTEPVPYDHLIVAAGSHYHYFGHEEWAPKAPATIGRASAVAELGSLELSGFLAWLAWLGVHVFFLIGLRNRLMVTFDWAYSYFTWGRSARLITGDLEDRETPESGSSRQTTSSGKR